MVEADETYIGGPSKGYQGRGVIAAPNKPLIAGAVEVHTDPSKNGDQEKKAGRLRVQILNAASAEEIKTFLTTNVTVGSTIKSEEWRRYAAEAMKGYHHLKHVQGRPERARELAPHIHNVFGNLHSWLVGIHHGVEPKYLQSYLVVCVSVQSS